MLARAGERVEHERRVDLVTIGGDAGRLQL